jgi:hypothetical protein
MHILERGVKPTKLQEKKKKKKDILLLYKVETQWPILEIYHFWVKAYV